ncbi:Protein of unknown function [bacterium A37T11]|nr:Protein of unknown function [bacterium A37T11]
MKTIHILTLTGLLFAACQNNSGNRQQTAKPKADTLTYHYTSYEKRSDKLVKSSESTDTSYFLATYPVFKNDTINQFVRSSVIINDSPDTTFASIEALGENFIGQFDKFHAKDPYPRVWTSETHAAVNVITPNYLSLAVSYENYTGGAHGNYGTVYSNYNIATHQEIRLADIIPQTYQKELNAIGERYFRAKEGLTDTASLKETYFFENGQFALNQNFYLSADSLHFLYNIYEIKPYVSGTTKLAIPLTDVERLLSPQAKVLIASFD